MAIAAVLIVMALSVALYLAVAELRDSRTQRQNLQTEMDGVLDGLVVMDKVVAYFARIWPDAHIMRVVVTGTEGSVMRLKVQVLAGGETLSVNCRLVDGSIEHDLREVLVNRTGVALAPIAALTVEIGGVSIVNVNAPQGMRVAILDVIGEWAMVRIDGKEGHMPLALFSLQGASFFRRPFSEDGHYPTDRAGLTPEALLRRYFAAYVAADFNRVADLHAHYPQPTKQAFVQSLGEARENGHRIWGYEISEHLMINANEAAVLVRYTFTSTEGRTATITDWWRLLKVEGVWKVAWFPRM